MINTERKQTTPIEWKPCAEGTAFLADVEVFELLVDQDEVGGPWQWNIYENRWSYGDGPSTDDVASGEAATEAEARLACERWYANWCSEMAQFEAQIRAAEESEEQFVAQNEERSERLAALAESVINSWEGDVPIHEHMRLSMQEWQGFIEYGVLPYDFEERHQC